MDFLHSIACSPIKHYLSYPTWACSGKRSSVLKASPRRRLGVHAPSTDLRLARRGVQPPHLARRPPYRLENRDLYHDTINLINEYYDKLELKVYACCLVPFSWIVFDNSVRKKISEKLKPWIICSHVQCLVKIFGILWKCLLSSG